jgi:hypothetical protein
MIILGGVGFLLVGALMLFIARPREGAMAPLLRGRYMEETYSVTVVAFIGMGVACIFGGLAGMGAS